MINVASSFFYFYLTILSVFTLIYLVLIKKRWFTKWVNKIAILFIIFASIDITYFCISYQNATSVLHSVFRENIYPSERLVGIEQTKYTVEQFGRIDTFVDYHARFFIFNRGETEDVTDNYNWYERYYCKYLIIFKQTKGKFRVIEIPPP